MMLKNGILKFPGQDDMPSFKNMPPQKSTCTILINAGSYVIGERFQMQLS